MKKNTIIVLVVLVLLLIIGGIFWHSLSGTPGYVQSGEQKAAMSDSSDTSNSALDQDSAAVDVQMSGLNNDSTAVNQSVSQ